MKVSIVLAFTLLICSNNCATGQPSQRAEWSLQALSAQINAQPKNADLYLRRGRLYSQYEETDLALSDLNRAIELKPSAEAYFERGHVYENDAQLEKAIKDYERAAQLDPKMAKALQQQANLHKALRHYDVALKLYTQILSENPGLATVRNQRAEVYLELHRGADALKDANYIFKTEATGPVHGLRGLAYLELHEYQKAIDDLSAAIKTNHLRDNWILARAECYEKLGKTELAKRDRAFQREQVNNWFENAPFSTPKKH
jgi:tetratricopeptide (TPR) repeat protein